MKSFRKQNSKLRIHSKPDRNQSKLTVCSRVSKVVADHQSRWFCIFQPYIKLVYEPTYSLEETMDVFARETNKDVSKLNEIDENDNDSVEGTVYILGQ